MSFRKVLFWVHLIAGVIAGSVIAIMSFTGAVLAFETEIVAWAERDARKVEVPANAVRLPLEDLQKRVREAYPDLRSAGVTVSSDPTDAVVFSAGREGGYYVNPYTGEIRQPASTKVHDFMHLMEDWHRWLAQTGENRAAGKAITGACNAAFLVLGVTGLYLWWPRTWTWRAMRPSVRFVSAQGKARDWNWHNVIGIWTVPVLIVLTASGMVISYRWASNLVYQIAGETPPQQQGPGGAAPASVEIARPAPGTRPLGFDAMLAAAQKEVPAWKNISLRSGGAQRGARGGAGAPGQAPAAGNRPATTTEGQAQRPAEANRERTARTEGGGENRGPQPVTATIRENGGWPLFASTTLTLNPFTGEIIKREGFSDFSTGRQARSWMRFLHTGQAFGPVGQAIAGIACLGALVLVWTGFALAWRRLFKRKDKVTAEVASEAVKQNDAVRVGS